MDLVKDEERVFGNGCSEGDEGWGERMEGGENRVFQSVKRPPIENLFIRSGAFLCFFCGFVQEELPKLFGGQDVFAVAHASSDDLIAVVEAR